MFKIIATIFICAVVVLGANFYFVEMPLRSAINADTRNEGIEIHGYAQYLVNPNHLVVDLWSVPPNSSMADVGRSLFQIAESLKTTEFGTVTLAYRGTAKFQLDGAYFKSLGEEVAAGQNPVFLIRTLPQNLKTPDGRNAYSEWTGGLIGVVGQQMEDFNDFHKQWYLNDMLLGN